MPFRNLGYQKFKEFPFSKGGKETEYVLSEWKKTLSIPSYLFGCQLHIFDTWSNKQYWHYFIALLNVFKYYYWKTNWRRLI